jgi:tRNA (mo5U34)-methyltransferase
MRQALMGLSPWRKGPFDLFGVHVDTEWRSD